MMRNFSPRIISDTIIRPHNHQQIGRDRQTHNTDKQAYRHTDKNTDKNTDRNDTDRHISGEYRQHIHIQVDTGYIQTHKIHEHTLGYIDSTHRHTEGNITQTTLNAEINNKSDLDVTSNQLLTNEIELFFQLNVDPHFTIDLLLWLQDRHTNIDTFAHKDRHTD